MTVSCVSFPLEHLSVFRGLWHRLRLGEGRAGDAAAHPPTMFLIGNNDVRVAPSPSPGAKRATLSPPGHLGTWGEGLQQFGGGCVSFGWHFGA